jgi:hypothetical protein
MDAIAPAAREAAASINSKEVMRKEEREMKDYITVHIKAAGISECGMRNAEVG